MRLSFSCLPQNVHIHAFLRSVDNTVDCQLELLPKRLSNPVRALPQNTAATLQTPGPDQICHIVLHCQLRQIMCVYVHLFFWCVYVCMKICSKIIFTFNTVEILGIYLTKPLWKMNWTTKLEQSLRLAKRVAHPCFKWHDFVIATQTKLRPRETILKLVFPLNLTALWKMCMIWWNQGWTFWPWF